MSFSRALLQLQRLLQSFRISMQLLWMTIITEMMCCKQDKKKQGPSLDVDPSVQYEIDRSELEAMDHIPPLFKVGTNILHYMMPN